MCRIRLELGAEGGVLNVVNLALKAPVFIEEYHAAPTIAQVGVVVGAEIDIINAVFAGDCPKKTTHTGILLGIDSERTDPNPCHEY